MRKFKEITEIALSHVRSTPIASWIAGVFLATVVGTVFIPLRSYGPESTVREFHRTLESIYRAQTAGEPMPMDDWERLRKFVVEDIGDPRRGSADPAAERVISFAYSQFQRGARFSLARMDRAPRQVLAAMMYTYPNPLSPPRTVVWVVRKVDGAREWKISAVRSLEAAN